MSSFDGRFCSSRARLAASARRGRSRPRARPSRDPRDRRPVGAARPRRRRVVRVAASGSGRSDTRRDRALDERRGALGRVAAARQRQAIVRRPSAAARLTARAPRPAAARRRGPPGRPRPDREHSRPAARGGSAPASETRSSRRRPRGRRSSSGSVLAVGDGDRDQLGVELAELCRCDLELHRGDLLSGLIYSSGRFTAALAARQRKAPMSQTVILGTARTPFAKMGGALASKARPSSAER